jgi:hypothetical protein
MSEPCGCADRTDHVAPCADPVLHIEHGERDGLNHDPEPHAVPGTGGWNGLYTASWDVYCLCGHPDYMSCEAWANGGGVAGLTMHNVGGYYLTTTAAPVGD